VRNSGQVAALTVRVVDARPAGAAGVLCADGDPRPLLPGEERTLSATAGVPVRVEAWNAEGVDLP
jgi:beta-mannosidase